MLTNWLGLKEKNSLLPNVFILSQADKSNSASCELGRVTS